MRGIFGLSMEKEKGPMCWLCYKQARDMVVALKEWKNEMVRGMNFWTCPDCKEEESDDSE